MKTIISTAILIMLAIMLSTEAKAAPQIAFEPNAVYSPRHGEANKNCPGNEVVKGIRMVYHPPSGYYMLTVSCSTSALKYWSTGAKKRAVAEGHVYTNRIGQEIRKDLRKDFNYADKKLAANANEYTKRQVGEILVAVEGIPEKVIGDPGLKDLINTMIEAALKKQKENFTLQAEVDRLRNQIALQKQKEKLDDKINALKGEINALKAEIAELKGN